MGRRWIVVVFVGACWLTGSLTGLVAQHHPELMLLALALAPFPVFGVIRDYQIAKRRTQPVRPVSPWIVAGLIATMMCAVADTLASVAPSMAFRFERGAVVYEYSLSIIVAPLLWAAVLIVAARALRIPSPLRLAISALTAITAWPFLLAIRAARLPGFAIEGKLYRVVAADHRDVHHHRRGFSWHRDPASEAREAARAGTRTAG